MRPLDGTATFVNVLERARRRLMARRLPLFATSWLTSMVVWTGVLLAEDVFGVGHAVALLATQALVLGVAITVVRVDAVGAHVRTTIACAAALLGISATVLFVTVGADGDLLAFVLLTLYLAGALFFAWGWRVALAVLVATAMPWLVARPWLRFYVPSMELVAAIGIGSTVCLAIAEVTARGFGTAFERGERERDATRALAESRDAYRDLAENASDLIYTHDLDGRLTYVNEAFARFAERSAEALVGRACQDLVARYPKAPDVLAILRRIAAGETLAPVAIPVEIRGELRWLECAISAIESPRGAIVGVRGIARDVTARRNAEEQVRASLAELRHSEEMLRLLARRQATIREDERKRIGFDLHDDVCQELVGVGIMLESLRRRIATTSPAEADGLRQIGGHLTEVLEHLRGLAHDLRPLLLRDLGLEGSLRSLADGMSSPTMRVSVRFPAPIPRLDEEVEIGVYRIAQEALANAARHADARAVSVTLALPDARLELDVADDGCGFIVDNERTKTCLGLVGMYERALALGGRVVIASQPGRGTTVHLDCPIAEPAHVAAI